MAKTLAIFLRVALYLLGATVPLALAVSYFHASGSIASPLTATTWEVIKSPNEPGQAGDPSRCFLIDRESDRCDIVPLPSGSCWGQLSVSPWFDAEGHAEAVCEAFGAQAGAVEQSFWGFARLRLPEGKVIDEVSLSILPTGRVCWVPDHPGRIVFAAGDGQLYMYDFPGWNVDPHEPVSEPATGSHEGTLRRVSWKGPPPPGARDFITEPVWPGHPRLRHLVFATGCPIPRNPRGSGLELTTLLWLQMREDGTVIEASGLLDVPPTKVSENARVLRRYPNVELGKDGTIRLVYLSRVELDHSFRLEVIPIEIDPATGHPRAPAHCLPRVLDEHCALVPPLFSADGMTVYTVSRDSGLIVKRQIEGSSPSKIHVASRG